MVEIVEEVFNTMSNKLQHLGNEVLGDGWLEVAAENEKMLQAGVQELRGFIKNSIPRQETSKRRLMPEPHGER